MDFVGIIAGIFIAVVLFVGGIATVATTISKHYAEINCEQFGEQTNREVRFVKYNFWNWDCLTPSDDGKWISTDSLREIVNGS
jgi:hypothetical protein